MARKRSPRYPRMSLEQAIEKAGEVYKSEHRHPAEQAVVAKAIGYAALHGAALGAIATLRTYGLLEPSGGGLRVSDDAVTLIELKGEKDNKARVAALQNVAWRPKVLHQLREKFEGQPPSDTNLRHWLIQQEFLSDAAAEVIRVYRKNLEFLSGEKVAYNGESEAKPEERGMPAEMSPAVQGQQQPPPKGPQAQEPPTSIGIPVFVDSRAVVANVEFGEPISHELLVALRRALASLEKPKD